METINDYMMKDHQVIDGFFERAEEAAKAADFATLEREANEFLTRIAVHIDVEDRLLFAAFEERTGMTQAGPSVTMREEHREMEPIFDAMREAVAARDAAGYLSAAAQLVQILTPHNQKEETMMYPMIDDAMGPDTRALLDEAKASMTA
ncbi:MAG: hemerythrin domain-containing protein [Burkholderiaceae bacterium]|nr:hemerythrin domain-containing protein [Burkholderiaceae bacterium]